VSERDPVFGCELATGRLDRDGYAYHGTSRGHIVAWVAVHGQVPAGKVLDHTCRRRNCRAVIHLELVTQSENEFRKRWAYRSRIKLCPAGHELAVHGMVTPTESPIRGGGRVCRLCARGR